MSTTYRTSAADTIYRPAYSAARREGYVAAKTGRPLAVPAGLDADERAWWITGYSEGAWQPTADDVHPGEFIDVEAARFGGEVCEAECCRCHATRD